jgi:hypothetical protein
VPWPGAALLALALLALHHALNPQRSRWWAATVGLALPDVLLYHGDQSVYAALACGFLSGALWLVAAPEERREVALRAVGTLLLSGPLRLNEPLAADVTLRAGL